MSYTKHVLINNFLGIATPVQALGAISAIKFTTHTKEYGTLTPASDSIGIQIPGMTVSITGETRNGGFLTTRSTPVFKPSDIVSITRRNPNTGTSQVHSVTPVLENGLAYIKVIDITDGRQKFPMVTIEGATSAELVAGLNKVGQQKDAFAGMSAAGNSPILITVPKNRMYLIATNDASSTTQFAAPVFTVGTLADQIAEEKEGLPALGVTNIAGPNTKIPISAVVPTLSSAQRISIALEFVKGNRIDQHEIVIYTLTDEAGTAGLQSTLAYWYTNGESSTLPIA
jgi:hypothetical protein